MGNTRRNWGNNRWNIRRNVGNILEISIRRISEQGSQQFSSRFIHCRIHPRVTVEYVLWANQYMPVHFSTVFFPTHGIFCKIYLNGGWCRVQISCFCLIILRRISGPHLDFSNNYKLLLIATSLISTTVRIFARYEVLIRKSVYLNIRISFYRGFKNEMTYKASKYI